ncbi:MAG: histone deacetylase family protein [Bacteroidetes bacterium]|nr:MAG: histone deacetylase family protein [Bacteroidota bacterium]
MKILFNSKSLHHNANSDAEGSYRIKSFPGNVEETDYNGEEFITLVHTKAHKNSIRNACMNNQVAAEVSLSPTSYEAAISAVGLAVKAAMQDDFAVIRPPGHHAGRERAAGFCLFNNIAIASQKLVNEGKKVFIFDFDGHHGDGTQSIFYDSDRVYYSSVHQAYAYPYSGFANETGEGKGKGFTLNIPLISGSGDKEFFEALSKVISEARKFKPDVIGISAGFDAYHKDRLLGLKLSQKAYYECGFRLRRAFPHIFAVLEGGYHDDIKECVEHFIDGVNVGARPQKSSFDDMMSMG